MALKLTVRESTGLLRLNWDNGDRTVLVNPELGGITLGPDGNVWFTDYLQGLVGFITPGGVITEIAGPTPNSALNAITTGSTAGGAKVLWFTEPNPNLIGKVTIP